MLEECDFTLSHMFEDEWMNKQRAVKLLRDQLVLFRNEDYLAINKPLGIETISGKEPPRSLREILDHLLMIKTSCPIPMNSMGSDASGVQLLSLHASAGRLARTMMKEGPFWRAKYWGILKGSIPGGKTSGIVNVPMKDGKIDSIGEPSITHWKVLKRGDSECLVEFEPRTLVPGQITTHCEVVLRSPLVQELGLHLYQLRACLPNNIDIEAPVRDDFKMKMQSVGWL